MEVDTDINEFELDMHAVSCNQQLMERGQPGKAFGSGETSSDEGNGESFNVRNELYVWPWVGVVANIPVQWNGGRYFGASSSRLRDELREKGYNPLRVQSLWNFKGHSGFAIVEFKNGCDGFSDAVRFNKDYEVKHQGKRDFFGVEERGDKLYCWAAQYDDFHSENVVGDYLRKHGNLKTIAQHQEEEKNKSSKLVLALKDTVNDRNMRLREIETKYKETAITLSSLMSEKDEMLRTFDEERKLMQQNEHRQLQSIFQGRERINSELTAQRNELKQRQQELEKREAQNENEWLKLNYEKQQNEQAILEQKKADEEVLRLLEDHKRETEKLRREMIELEKKLDEKQALELKIEHLKSNLLVVKHMGDDGDEEATKKMDAIKQELDEKKEALEDLETLNQALIIKERRTNDEVQEARKELIKIFSTQPARALIGIRKMGALDTKPFVEAAKRKKSSEELSPAADELWRQWHNRIRDPDWYPFKIVPVEEGNGHKEILDEEDPKLKSLRNELGEDVYQAVTTALMEVNECNGSGRYAVAELWNKKDNRRATVKEGVTQLITQWIKLKKKKQ